MALAERGEIQAYNGVGKLDWGFGPAGAEAVITGIVQRRRSTVRR
jgi:hypothetical protein